MLLEAKGLVVSYYKNRALHRVSLAVDEGEIVLLIGQNGSGKSTSLKAIFGLLVAEGGEVFFRGKRITNRKPSLNVADGICFVPQGRHVFPNLSVSENLDMGIYALKESRAEADRRKGTVYKLFPILEERGSQKAGLLSGGEQQMLTLSMALMQNPKLLILDEPSLGLSPLLVQQAMEYIRGVNQRLGTAILFAEQNITAGLSIAQRVYGIKGGEILFTDTPAKIMEGGELVSRFWAGKLGYSGPSRLPSQGQEQTQTGG